MQCFREIRQAEVAEIKEVSSSADFKACSEPHQDPGDHERSRSSSSSSASSFLDDESVGFTLDKATQVRQTKIMNSKKIQTQLQLEACSKCAQRKAQIKTLQRTNSRLRSQREKWKERCKSQVKHLKKRFSLINITISLKGSECFMVYEPSFHNCQYFYYILFFYC